MSCLDDEAANAVVEYGLLISAVAAVVLLAPNAFGQLTAPWFPRWPAGSQPREPEPDICRR
jgi:hypothetical protein